MLIDSEIRSKYPKCSSCGVSNSDEDVYYPAIFHHTKSDGSVIEGKWICCECNTVFEDEEAFERVEEAIKKKKRKNIRLNIVCNFKKRLDLRYKENKEKFNEVKDLSLEELEDYFDGKFLLDLVSPKYRNDIEVE